MQEIARPPQAPKEDDILELSEDGSFDTASLKKVETKESSQPASKLVDNESKPEEKVSDAEEAEDNTPPRKAFSCYYHHYESKIFE